MRKLLVKLFTFVLLVALPLGAARDFDAIANKVQTGTVDILNGARGSTIAAWINVPNQDDDFAGICEYRGTTASSFESALELRSGANDRKITFAIWTATSGFKSITSATAVSASTWTHVAGVYDGTNIRIYINGVDDANDTWSGNLRSNDRLVTIGLNPEDDTGTKGNIAEVGIWNVGLSPSEILVLSKKFSPLFVKRQNLVGYWPLIGRTSPEIDLINGNNGTVTGTTVASHPPAIYPTQPISGFSAAAVPPAGKRRVIIISEMLKYAPAPILAGGLGLAWVINRRNKLIRDGRN